MITAGRQNRRDAAAALCELPTYLQEHPCSSLTVRAREVLESVADVCEDDLLGALEARPRLIDSWSSYVEDQRTADALYVRVRQTPTRGVEWVVARADGDDIAAFSSVIAAYARLIAELLRLPKR